MRLHQEAELAVCQPRPVGGLSVLIVEDDPDNAMTEDLLLRSDGHSVRCVQTGEAALHEVREWGPDIILLELGLPGMTGYEVAGAVFQMHLRKRPLIIAVTASDDRRRSEKA